MEQPTSHLSRKFSQLAALLPETMDAALVQFPFDQITCKHLKKLRSCQMTIQGQV